jgi:hypothetical protein
LNGVVETPPPATGDEPAQFPKPSQCVVKNSLMICQNARDFVLGRQGLTEDEAAKFAAMYKKLSRVVPLIGTEKEPPADEESKADPWVNTKLWDVPAHLKRKTKEDEFAKRVEEAMADPDVVSVNKESYLTMALSRRLFGAQFYRVRSNPKKLDAEAAKAIGILPPLVDLAVNQNGLFVLETATRKIINNWSLLQIMGWSHKPNSVKMKVKKSGSSKKNSAKTQFTLEFFTDDAQNQTGGPGQAIVFCKGKEICELLLQYATEMVRQIEIAKKLKKKQKAAAKAAAGN